MGVVTKNLKTVFALAAPRTFPPKCTVSNMTSSSDLPEDWMNMGKKWMVSDGNSLYVENEGANTVRRPPVIKVGTIVKVKMWRAKAKPPSTAWRGKPVRGLALEVAPLQRDSDEEDDDDVLSTNVIIWLCEDQFIAEPKLGARWNQNFKLADYWKDTNASTRSKQKGKWIKDYFKHEVEETQDPNSSYYRDTDDGASSTAPSPRERAPLPGQFQPSQPAAPGQVVELPTHSSGGSSRSMRFPSTSPPRQHTDTTMQRGLQRQQSGARGIKRFV
jgi:hypothetical protein